jgi:hypothetical protein
VTINQFRGLLYGLAKVLGDVQAGVKAARTRSFKPIGKRLARRAAGKVTGRALGRIFR